MPKAGNLTVDPGQIIPEPRDEENKGPKTIG
jgi:hypothetical protein